MPLAVLAEFIINGPPPWMPDPWLLLKAGTGLGALAVTKRYMSGAASTAERVMHGRVVLITGGTSGIGAATTYEMARRGAQVVLLTHVAASDPFLVEFIEDMRERTGNHLIYAEHVDLTSLHSVRQFATRWIDNAPPRRLDMIILCAATLTPPDGSRTETAEGVETTWMVNYLANVHLLAILSPAIRAQPFDRDVRIILTTCSAYIGSPPLDAVLDKKDWSPGRAYARSKLALMSFGRAYQKHLDAYKRPDDLPMNARVFLVDPGLSRTPGTRRWLSRGSLWGLLLYVLLYAFSWLFLKSPEMGAQSILFAVFQESLIRLPGGRLIKECMVVDCARKDVDDEAIAKKLWESSDKLIERVEKDEAVRRARAKKELEKMEDEAKTAEKVDEIESLLDTIKKGKANEAKKSAASSKKPKPGGGKAAR
ncbi:hypothetical protein B0T26DRAFT_325238 [Lasiosphaeria miniovina]|uniref:Oxidoreductase n=1 Tax=Lasiosphaeria miniovina TaxID=1954250 RepID=A0AA40ALY5_9PEZI|nr:uncharacterized protein B0T26DRAFT_325238 [Lasiosphaeria miniovina]KAK0718303.1 hypothetical protein B0T26DRAFT_325238 [Lasiosphaeria miniovina]